MLGLARALRSIRKVSIVTPSQWKRTSVNSSSLNIKLKVDPVVSLIDEKVDVSVHGLFPEKEITLRAEIIRDVNEKFESFAQGRVMVSSQALFHVGIWSRF